MDFIYTKKQRQKTSPCIMKCEAGMWIRDLFRTYGRPSCRAATLLINNGVVDGSLQPHSFCAEDDGYGTMLLASVRGPQPCLLRQKGMACEVEELEVGSD